MRKRRSARTAVLALILALATVAPTSAASVKFRITVSPSRMDFGTVVLGEQTAPQVLYATNRSPVPLRWTRTVFEARPATGTFDLTVDTDVSACADFVVQPGQTCGLVIVAYTPGTRGTYYLDVVSTFTDGATVVTVTSSGRGKVI